MDCKVALQETNGDIKEAVDYLRKKGIATAKERGGRVTSEGQVQSYIHAGGKIGVLVEVNCETDFTGK
ncbi:MAG: elongation factor Ts, partial [Desulfobacteraceae bacterium]